MCWQFIKIKYYGSIHYTVQNKEKNKKYYVCMINHSINIANSHHQTFKLHQ